MEISKQLRRVCLGVVLSALTCVSYAEQDADTVITKNVETNLSKTPALEGIHLSITTHEGVVSVSGALKTDEQSDIVKKVIKETPGVKDVDTSKLSEAKSEHPVTDSVITSKVKALFIKEKLLGDKAAPNLSIDVETKDGVVYLTGKTETDEQMKKAEEIARSVKGVKDVDNKVMTGNTINQVN